MSPLGVMAPETFKRAPFEEYRRPNPRSVMDGEALDMKHHSCIDHEIRLSLPGTKKRRQNPREGDSDAMRKNLYVKIGEADAKIKWGVALKARH
jgi:hypothetical protein